MGRRHGGGRSRQKQREMKAWRPREEDRPRRYEEPRYDRGRVDYEEGEDERRYSD